MSDTYTPQELMVAVASREIRDHDLVFVGMRNRPVAAPAVAPQNTTPPSA
jgi:acyl CoA:acetate/3-ketoacid CoA transferase beta subunit